MTRFMTDLQAQLVAASRELSQQRPARDARPRGIRRWRTRRVLLSLSAALLLSGTAVAATSQLPSKDDGPAILRRQAALMRERRDHPHARARGLDPSRARPVMTLADGTSVSELSGAAATCLLLGTREEHCYSAGNIAAGIGYTIGNDCSAGSGDPMRVLGVAPQGTAGVRVDYSSGPGLDATPVADAFAIEATTPSDGAPYPVRLRFLDREGTLLRSSAIRDGADLCMRGDGTPAAAAREDWRHEHQ